MGITPSKHWLSAYGIAFLAVLIAPIASLATSPIGNSSTWLFFIGAVTVTAWFGGRRPGLVATVALCIIGRFFFMAPYYGFSLTRETLVQILMFVGLSLLISYLTAIRRRMDMQLRDARARLEAALSAGAIATWTWDLPNDRIIADANLARLFSISPQDAQGGPVSSYLAAIHSEDRERISRIIDETIATGTTFDAEYRVVQPDGTSRWVVARGQVELDANARPLTFSGAVVDITARKDGEREREELATQLALQARLFNTALSNAPDFIYTFDLDGRFTYVNRAPNAMWRHQDRNVIGKNFFELGYPHDLAERIFGQIRKVIESKAKVIDESPLSIAIGTRQFEYIFVPVLGPDGEVEAIVGSTRDITERKEIERATRRRAEQLKKLAEIATRINSAHDLNSIIGVVTEEIRNLIGVRQAAINVILAPHLPSVNFIANATERDQERHVADTESPNPRAVVKEEHRPIRLKQEDLKDDPRWQTLEKGALAVPMTNGWLAAPLIGRNGKNLGLLQLADKNEGEFTFDDEAVLVQLTQLAAIAIENAGLYEELRSNDQHKDEFLAMLAHELRNPLAAIGNAVGVTKRSGLKEHADWSIDVITRQIMHLTRLIDDLLDVSRINRGKIELRKDLLDVTPILENAAATVQALMEDRKHTLDLQIDRGNLWARVDPTRLEQIVVNLLNNAAKYSENGRRIRLWGRVEREDVVISVTDQGIGIPPDKLPQMFELFTQGDRSLARSEGGLGIGLTVVKKLIEMHGGSVTATSEGAGKGSEFTIRLPIATRPTETKRKSPGLVNIHGRKLRILVVDDNHDTAVGMSKLLRLLGHEVTAVHDGYNAIETAKEFNPDFVLLDIGLPGMDGYEVAARLRQDACCKNATIVAISGYGQDDDRRRSKEAGFDHHLIKPLDHDALLTLLSNKRNG